MQTDTEAARLYATTIVNAFGDLRSDGVHYDDGTALIVLGLDGCTSLFMQPEKRLVLVAGPKPENTTKVFCSAIPVPFRRHLNEVARLAKEPAHDTTSVLASHLLAGKPFPISDNELDVAISTAIRLVFRSRLHQMRTNTETLPT